MSSRTAALVEEVRELFKDSGGSFPQRWGRKQGTAALGVRAGAAQASGEEPRAERLLRFLLCSPGLATRAKGSPGGPVNKPETGQIQHSPPACGPHRLGPARRRQCLVCRLPLVGARS